VNCASCGAENETGRRFCGDCGAPLAISCPACGGANQARARFCGDCGSPLVTLVTQTGRPQPDALVLPTVPAGAAVAERRLVSVLFADLVGFTTLSERRDAEEVRDLLTRYFEECRSIVARYGGEVEKFIGDAVMAVWGAPAAHEDDAERAVRAALDLVKAVQALGIELGEPALQARAGVLTGDAAVTMGASSQGMVAGDLVNTASRIQAEAKAGTVLVGEATREATEAAVVYEDVGERALKGKTEPVRLWRPLRVVAFVGGALKSEGLEAPFVGRDRELRQIKDQFHASADEHRAHLVSVVGIAGIGKSRLSWEFFKYIDGIAELVLTHRGRCLAYGEGVTYWALAEMVRMRTRITEGEDPVSARTKLQACLTEYISDTEERRWVEPPLAQLLGLEDHATQERQDLFSAWRLFFERLAATAPVVLLFEDMQWADTSLLDFIEYLLEWSRSHALYVVTLARPELVDRHTTWGAGKRNFTSMFLEPLQAPAMEQLLDGLVPGLPDELREQILQRAEGVPLYAVETVRMLLDRGLLERAGSVYKLTGPVEDLDVPQSLHGLIAARLDGLRPEARRALQDAAVLGKTFTVQALAAISSMPPEQLEPLLDELVRKEVLSRQMDPRSPERGQYGFLQDLVKRVAYETLSKRDRKEKHLAVAAWFESSWGGEEADVVEVMASHYLEAYNLGPNDPDADQVKERAADVLVRAGQHAGSLAAAAEAERYYEMASRLVGTTQRQAELHEQAGQMARRSGRAQAAAEHYERAIALYEDERLIHASARVSGRLAGVEQRSGHVDEALRRLERAFAVLSNDGPADDLAEIAMTMGATLLIRKGDVDAAEPYVKTALDIAESLRLMELLSRALNYQGLIAGLRKHPEEAVALLSHSLKMALESDIGSAAVVAYNNLADLLSQRDRYVEALSLQRSCLALARKIGDRSMERFAIAELAYVLMQLGEWDEASAFASSIGDAELKEAGTDVASILSFAETYIHRGQLPELERLLEVFAPLATSGDLLAKCSYVATRAGWYVAVGRYAEALADADEAMSISQGMSNQDWKAGMQDGFEAAFALKDFAMVERLLTSIDSLRPGERPPLVEAQAARFRARLADARGDQPSVEAGFIRAEDILRELELPFRLAVVQLEHAEWMAAHQRGDEAQPLLADARRTFERLEARPWLERLSAATSSESMGVARAGVTSPA
jgi:predicted ATPase/class 3 adenylate cyclase